MSNIFVILPMLNLVLGIVFCCFRKLRIAGKIITVVSSGVLLFYAWVFAIFIFAFGSGSGSIYLNDAVYVIPICVIPVFAFLAICFGVLAWKKKWGRALFITFASLALASIIIPIAIVGYNNSIPVVSENTPYYEYDPYSKDSKIVVLDDASFEIGEDYPVLDGATALYPVYSAFFRAVYPREVFEADELEKYEHLHLSTTTGAYNAIVNGDADIIFVASASEAQKKYAEEQGVELEFIPLGSEAFVFFVNKDNPIDNVTLGDVKRIYTGEVTSWSELGADGLGEIVAFQRDEGSGSQTALEQIIGKDELIKAPGREIAGMGEMIYQVADYKNYKNAIGYSFRYYATVMNKNSGLKVLSLNGIEPTAENIKNGTYPITGNFYAVIRSDAGENVREFIDWMLSDEGQAIIEQTGYVPLD